MPDSEPPKSKAGGAKYLIYDDLLPALARLSSVGYKPRTWTEDSKETERGGIGWAANFVIRQFTAEAIAMLSREFTQVACYRFNLKGYRFEVKISAPTDQDQPITAGPDPEIDSNLFASIISPPPIVHSSLPHLNSSRSSVTPQSVTASGDATELQNFMSKILGS